jgi:hypothetical protein
VADPKLQVVEPRLASGTYPVTRVQRRHVRIPVRLDVIVVSPSGEDPGLCTDIGIGGMFIATEAAAEYGDEVMVLVEPPAARKLGLAATTLCLPSTVRWHDSAGIGVQFGLLGAGETRGLIQLIRSHSGRY